MRVLIVSHAYVERSNHKKLELLSRFKDLEVGVVYPKRWRTWHGEVKDQKSNIRDQKSYKEFPLNTYFSSDAGKYHYNTLQLIISIFKFKPDLIHLEEEPFSLVAFQLAFICRLLGIKFTFFTWENISNLKLGLIRSIFEKIVFFYAAAALAGTSGGQERLLARGFTKRIEIIPQFGVDTELFFKKEIPLSQRSLLDKNEILIGFVGRPTLDKGVDILFEALSKLPEKYQLLWVTSSASIPSVLNDRIRTLGLKARVRIETNIPHEKLPDFYRQMDIFVLPSRTIPTWQEQFGRSLIEAMACGLPVVGSSSGAIPEVIGEAGLAFAEGESEDLRNKIIKLEDDFLYEQFQKKGWERVESLYSIEVVASRIYKFFNSLI